MRRVVAESIFKTLQGPVAAHPSLTDVKGWVLQEQFHVRSPPNGGVVEIFPSTAVELHSAFRNDFCFVASSAIESYLEARRKLRDSRALAWSIVKSYYAAYFAAHALMRLMGYGYMWAESGHVKSLKTVCKLWLGNDTGLPGGGGWSIRPVSNFTGISISGAGGTKGGSHESFWCEFSLFLSDILSLISGANSIVAADATFVLVKLNALQTYVDSAKFVKVRHNVNYKRGHGLWHPFIAFDADGEVARENIQSRLAGADLDMLDDFSSFGDLLAFSFAVRGLLALLSELTSLVDSRFPLACSDLRASPLRMLKQSKIM